MTSMLDKILGSKGKKKSLDEELEERRKAKESGNPVITEKEVNQKLSPDYPSISSDNISSELQQLQELNDIIAEKIKILQEKNNLIQQRDKLLEESKKVDLQLEKLTIKEDEYRKLQNEKKLI